MKELQSYFRSWQIAGGMLHRVTRAAHAAIIWTLLATSSVVSAADEQVYDIDIPPLNAAEALNRLAEQTDAVMLYPYDLAEAKQANSVSGRYTLMEALEVLLRNTGLLGSLSDMRVIQITPGEAEAKDEDETMGLHGTRIRKKVAGVVAAMFVASGALAQEDQINNEEPEEEQIDEITVTGSRVKRNTFDSLSPMQLVDAEASRDIGLTEASDILQYSGSASGLQIDNTFTSFVLDNGPGSQTIDLRGLGSSRTLVLLNGRRLAPSGVEGAPSVPSINTIPSGLVDRYEILLDGASSVYGSDAVAGVTNVIMRNDFDGPEIYIYGDVPSDGGGETINGTFAWGKNFDRGFVGFGVDLYRNEPVRLEDRDFLSDCERHQEIGTDGRVRSNDISRTERFGNLGVNYPSSPCTLAGTQSRRIFSGPLGNINLWNSSAGNLGSTDFSIGTLFGAPIDANGDGNADVVFNDYTINGNNLDADFIYEFERVNVMSYGELTLDGAANITPYYEVLYTKSESTTAEDFRSLPIFPTVPAANPYNICNPANANGIDCGLAYDAVLLNDNVGAALIQMFPGFYDENGDGTATLDEYRSISQSLTFGPLPNGIDLIPVVSVRGDRDNTTTEVEQIRIVAGLRGDIPILDELGPLNDWTFDVSYSYSTAEGKASRRGIRGDRLAYTMNNTIVDGSGNIVCPGRVDGDTLDCVPVNMLAPSLYSTIIGDFATQAERDYLFDDRNFDTTYDQTMFSAFATGEFVELPAGPLSAVIGVDYRVDEIDSQPDEIARDGLFFGFFSDQGASGDRWTREVFGELVAPLVADKFLVSSLDVEFAARHTTDEFFGSDTTFSAKLGYRPVDSLLLRTTVGTSFRAPNVRENFLRSQTSFFSIFDPCSVPNDALNPVTGEYNADLDTRDASVLQNCTAANVDPTSFNPGSFLYSAETSSGGQAGLTEETSEALSAGFSFRQPFFDAFDFVIGATYYDIDIEDTIIEPGAQFIINDCFSLNEGLSSAFCSRIQRDPDGFIDFIDGSFINQDQEVARGVDINLAYAQDVTLFGAPAAIGLRIDANRNLERTSVFIDDNGVVDRDEFVGEFGFPKWRAQGTVTLDLDDWRLSWLTRYIGSVAQDPDFVDEFSDIFDTNDTGFTSSTCTGIANGDVDCRDVGFVDHYFVHTLSLAWSNSNWRIVGGIRNLFDEEPPLVDGNEVFSISNVPIGNGYDLDGRTFFASVQLDIGSE